MSRLFGTDGVRGIANKELTGDLAYKIGRIGGYHVTKGKKKPKIVIGMDTRISCDMLEGAVTAGICSAGVDVLYAGVLPTPAIACLIRELNADGGVMISASHNPYIYNGIKLFNSDGFKLSDDLEEEIENVILGGMDIHYYPTEGDIGRKIPLENPMGIYMDCIMKTTKSDFSGLKIAMDCANGAVYGVAPEALKALGAQVFVINNKPNGININVNCGSTHPEAVQNLVKDTGADIGLSFDGDADRLIAVDHNGKIVDGDHIMAICGNYMKKMGKLKNNTIVGTVMSNMGLDICLKERGIAIIKTQVGDRYVLEEMRQSGFTLGGEQSGHIIFLDYNTTGDGLLTAVQLISALVEQNKTLTELSSIMYDYPQVLVNASVKNENKKLYLEDKIINQSIIGLELEFEGKGRVLIRPSGTEPLVRVMIEGENEFEIRQKAVDLSKLIESRLG
ncbi:MAG: Phosphoglucosamine mutase [Clostridiales bacterium 38_11]|nr:MAG: Phosphoglucosamine mutase [Clostridiales bacterium 38_11]